jgi:hypothetical protein
MSRVGAGPDTAATARGAEEDEDVVMTSQSLDSCSIADRVVRVGLETLERMPGGSSRFEVIEI